MGEHRPPERTLENRGLSGGANGLGDGRGGEGEREESEKQPEHISKKGACNKAIRKNAAYKRQGQGKDRN